MKVFTSKNLPVAFRSGSIKLHPRVVHDNKLLGAEFKKAMLAFSFCFISLLLSLFLSLGEKSHANLPGSLDQVKAESQRLEHFLKANPADKKKLDPFKRLLDAEIFYIKKDHKRVYATLDPVMNHFPEAFSKDVSVLYLQNEIKRLSLKSSKRIYDHTRKLAAEKKSSYFVVLGKLSSHNLQKRLTALLPGTFQSFEPKLVADILPPTQKELASDPLLEETSDKYCNARSQLSSKQQQLWTKWEKKLGTNPRLLWNAYTAQCTGKGTAAMKMYENLYSLTKNHETDWRYGLWALKKAVVWQRRNSQRRRAAENYVHLANLWINHVAVANDFAMEKAELLAEKSNDFLWAGRYQAMIGNYKIAENFFSRGLTSANEGYAALTPSTPKNVIRDLKEYRVEGYQSPADRIFVENSDFKKARSYIEKAIALPSAGKVWDDRLRWFRAFYSYLAEEHENAIGHFDALISGTDSSYSKTKGLFWKARSLNALKRFEEASKIIETIQKEFPLSYYSLMGASLSFDGDSVPKLNKKEKRNYFLGLVDSASKTSSPSNSAVPPLTESVEKALSFVPGGKTEVKDSLLLLEAGLKRYGGAIVYATYQRSRKIVSALKRPDFYRYFSELLHASGYHIWAITVTNQLLELDENHLEKNPEQLFVLFPSPYLDAYLKVEARSNVDHALMLAISRQESAFKTDAVSPAMAYGLMQLIRPTAKSMAKDEGLPTKDITDSLLEPYFNVRLGGAYLKHLSRRYENKPHLVFAAYNAGETAVDTWIERRRIKDTLAWIEAIPYGETRKYVKNVSRNVAIYQHLRKASSVPGNMALER